MRSLLAAVLALLTLLHPVWAQEASSDKATIIEHYRLKNGLEVVLAPDRRVPKVVLDIAYRVGSLNEPPGRSGFAHLFEHLMFSGTPAYPNIDEAYGAVGVGINAWTYQDKTLYYAEGLSSALPFMLALEADRMANQGLAIEQSDLDIQRDVVLNEMRQTVLDTPAAAGWEAMRSALYPEGHPYHRQVLGSMADLEAATLDDVRGFFATYYVPNNAILTLVGDFDIADVKALIDATFALVPRGADVPRPSPVEVTPQRARIELQDAVAALAVMNGWTTPPYQSPVNGALDLAAELIGNFEYGLLRERLTNMGLTANAWSWLERGALGGRFFVEVAGAEGVDAKTIETELRAALADFAAKPIDPADLERARRKLLQADRLLVEPFKARAEEMAVTTDMLGSPEAAVEPDPGIANATAEEVSAAVRQYLAVDDASVMVITPGKRGNYPDVLLKSSGEPQPYVLSPRDFLIIPPQPVRVATPAELPARQTATLSNGMAVVHYQVPGAAMTYVAVASAAGTTSVPPGKEGMVELAAGMAPRGAGDMDFQTFAKAAKDLEADVSASADYLAAFVQLSVPPENLAAAVPLLASAMRAPRFDDAAWESLVDETLFDLGRRDEDLEDLAQRVAEAQLLIPEPGAPANDRSMASVRGISRAEAQAFFQSLFAPAGLSFYSVGPMPVEEVADALEDSFGDWRADTVPLAQRPRPVARFESGQHVVFVPKPGASQSVVLIATPAPGSESPGHAETIAVSRLLGDDFLSRINSVIREQKGFSYGSSGEVIDTVRAASYMVVLAPVERDHTGDALADMLAGYASLTAEPVRPDEVNRTVTDTLTGIAGTAETAANLFDAVREQAGIASTLEADHARRLAVAGLTVDPVRTEAETQARLDPSLIVVVGDPETVLPQLRQLGFDPVEVDAVSLKPVEK